MDVPLLIQVVGVTALLAATLVLALRVFRPTASAAIDDPAPDEAIGRALSRTLAERSAGTVVALRDLEFLANVHEVVRDRDTLAIFSGTRGGAGQGMRDTFARLDGALAPGRRPEPREESGVARGGDGALERVLKVLPRGKQPSFVHGLIPDPTVLPGVGAESESGGGQKAVEPKSGDGTGTRTYEYPGRGHDEESTTESEDGTRKTAVTHFDTKGNEIGRAVTVERPDGSRHTWMETYGDRIVSRDEYDSADGRLLGSRHYWRSGEDNRWRPGSPVEDLMECPSDEPRGGNAHYFVRLANGGIACCVVLNSLSGVGYCTVWSADRVNPARDSRAPTLAGGTLVIDPYDLVVNPDPTQPPPGGGSSRPGRMPGFPEIPGSPGGRPPPPDVPQL